MFKENNLINLKVSSKQEVLIGISEHLAANYPNINQDEVVGKLLMRESQSTTGFEQGIAIPHAVVSTLTAPVIILSRFNPVNWNSLDGNDTDTAICILVPENSGDSHLQILGQIAGKLTDDQFIADVKGATAGELVQLFDIKVEESVTESVSGGDLIVGITGCPTGIAHTFMAAENIIKVGNKLGYEVAIETHGQNGPTNKLTKEQIARAKAVIIAADVQVDLGRFGGKKVYKTNVANGVHADENLFTAALDAPVYTATDNGENQQSEKFSVYQSLMSGVTHMLPFVVAGGILIALRFFFGTEGDIASGVTPIIEILPVGTFFGDIGGLLFGMMLPVLGAYIAFSIGGRQGLMPGFLAGLLASSDGSGFLGAILGGFLAGFIAKWFVNQIPNLPKSIQGSATILFIPLLTAITLGLIMKIVAVPVGALNTGLTTGLTALQDFSPLLLGALLGAMMAADMGGPINKAAYVTGTLLLAEGNQVFMAAVMAGGMTPPLIIALANILKRDLFNKEEKQAANTNWIMGLAFITEGAIPFAAKNPVRVIPALVAGSAVSGALTMLFKITLPAPHGGIFVFPLVNSPLLYLLAIVIGTIVGAIILVALLGNSKE